jgi:hypothetical protein
MRPFKTLENLIQSREKQPLTFPQVNELTGGKFPIINYEDLPKYNSIQQVCGDNGCILYLPVETINSGHYISMFIRGNVLYYTDSYGFDIRTDLNKATYILKNEQQRYLSDLLIDFKNQGGFISVNPYGYQKLSSSTNTCGRYAIIRLFFQGLNHEQFHAFLQYKNLKPDEIVSLMTWQQ